MLWLGFQREGVVDTGKLSFAQMYILDTSQDEQSRHHNTSTRSTDRNQLKLGGMLPITYQTSSMK